MLMLGTHRDESMAPFWGSVGVPVATTMTGAWAGLLDDEGSICVLRACRGNFFGKLVGRGLVSSPVTSRPLRWGKL